MTPLDDFSVDITVYAPGCPDMIMNFGLRQAAIEFCERTRLWRFEDEISVLNEESEFIAAPNGAVIHEIETIVFEGLGLQPATVAWLDANVRNWRTGEITGPPKYYTQTEQDTIRLVPRGAGVVRLSVWVKPSQDADELPDFMAAQYREIISHGALARILMIPNQAFTNIDLAAAYGRSFENKMLAVINKGFTGQQRASLRTQASFF